MVPKKGSHELLGQLLVNRGAITEQQLEDALDALARGEGEPSMLGRLLVRLGYCTEEDVARAVAARSGVRYVRLEGYNIDQAAMAVIPPEVAKKYMALPIGFSGDRLTVAMQRPADIVALDDLRILTGMDIDPVAVPDSELEIAISNYGTSAVGVEHSVEEEGETQEEAVSADQTSEQPAVQLANLIMSQAVEVKASDVHIEPYEQFTQIRFRIDGVLHDMLQSPKRLHASLVSRFKVMANMDIAERRVPQDGRMTLRIDRRLIDVRMASLPTSYGERLTLRLLNRSAELITLERLGVSPETLAQYERALRTPYGLILVTGPTGSGKSTSLYASLAAVDKQSKNVITVEDPIEYRMKGISQIQVNVRAGLTFASGLRSILRSDPDIIMVGEIRDKETARIAIESALTGHLVFSTLHTNDASGAISRLGEMGVEPYLTASSLICVIAQRLARVLCPHCKVPYVATERDLVGVQGLEDAAGSTLYKALAGGCMRCSGTGYKGRIGVFELLVVDDEIRRMTLGRRSAGEIKEVAVQNGTKTLWQDGLDKVRAGITSIEEIMRVIV